MKKITFLIFLMCTALTFGQGFSRDFEDGSSTVDFQFGNLGFANIANPDTNGNPSTRVLEVTKGDTAEWFGGIGWGAGGGPVIADLSLGTSFTIKIWSPKANLPVRFEIQDPGGIPSYNVIQSTGAANTWTELTFDFSSQVTTGAYRVIVIQPDYDIACEGGGCGQLGAGNGAVHYIDDVAQIVTFDPNADASLSDLTLDGTTIAGFAPSETNYNVDLPNGTTTAPTVAAVAAQAGNGSSNVSVTQAGSVPGTATVDVTAPNGTDMRTYTVNFVELPPAAPVPTENASAVIPIITNNTSYTDIGIPFLEPFGATVGFADLDGNGSDDAFSFNGGNGGQINYFGNTFVDIRAAGILHFDFYAETLNAADNINVLLLGSDPPNENQNFRIDIDESQPGVWQSFEIGLNGAGSGLPDEFNGTANTAFDELALIQFITGEVGSTLPSTTFYISNVYFRGGTLSTPDFELAGDFTVAPNPTKDTWTITTSNSQNLTSVIVYDILGKEVMNIKPNAFEVTLEASDLKNGIYLAKLATENGTRTIKLVKN